MTRHITSLLGGALVLLSTVASASQDQPKIKTRVKPTLHVGALSFKDLNSNGILDPYEDWRLTPAQRAADLVGRMTIPERAGMMMIDTLLAGCNGTSEGTPAANLIKTQYMTRFIVRNKIDTTADTCQGRPPVQGWTVTAQEFVRFANDIQSQAEATRLGIPVVLKSNPRNHHDPDARFGIASSAGIMTEFPKELGIAAAVLGTGNMEPVRALTEVVGQEWQALGIRGMYGYMADLATEPRWYRVGETFGEDSALTSNIIRNIVTGLQGEHLNSDSAVALTIKHFPGGGPQLGGLDPHYSFGKEQTYAGGAFAKHLAPFQAAIDAGVSAIMPYYGQAMNLQYDGLALEPIGMSFSDKLIDGVLRQRLGFGGYVNSDTGIIKDRAWGLETHTVQQRLSTAINAGVDLLSGFSNASEIEALIAAGMVSENRLNQAVVRLLQEQFALGLFENPYVDERPTGIGTDANRARGLEVQRQSVVLLANKFHALPLETGKSLYVIGTSPDVYTAGGFTVTDGNTANRPTAAHHDVALIRVNITNMGTQAYRTNDPAYGANLNRLNPRSQKVWGAEDPCNIAPALNPTCVDDMQIAPGVKLGLIFGGALPWEVDNISFSAMASSQSWKITPTLETIQAIMDEIGASKTILDVNFRNPYVIDQESGLRDSGAIIASFGASDTALLDVLTGKFPPKGKLPFALAATLQAVLDNMPDLPGYQTDTLYPFGFGLTYN
ncbi:beta-glucosidase [Agrobacterium vitis]|nr:beta-glucosidase [Agrobacterium vitis]MBE1440077.1 beta-glucosidase [Agrobacterium vitis]